MLSHELRAPLMPVVTWADAAAKQSNLSPEIQKGLKMVCRNSELGVRLIEDLLDLSRLTRRRLKLHLGTADAHELLQSALDIVRSDMEDRHLKLVVSLAASRHELVADAPRSKFSGASFATPASSRRKTARFPCGRTIPTQERSPSRSATAAWALNHNLSKESLIRSNKPIRDAKVSGLVFRSAKRSSKCTGALSVHTARDKGKVRLS